MPKTTVGYCYGSTNKNYIDPNIAQTFGFSAPIIAGNQTINFLMERLCINNPPERVLVQIRFSRPVFWGDTIDIQTRTIKSGKDSLVRALNSHGKTMVDLPHPQGPD